MGRVLTPMFGLALYLGHVLLLAVDALSCKLSQILQVSILTGQRNMRRLAAGG